MLDLYYRSVRHAALLMMGFLSIGCLSAQSFRITPYVGFDSEIIYSIPTLQVEELVLTSNIQAATVPTYGLGVAYTLTTYFDISLDLNYRQQYLYSYSIFDKDPFPDSYFSSSKGITNGVNEWTVTLAPSLRIPLDRNWLIIMQAGLGYNVTAKRSGGAEYLDFGPYLESTTVLWNTLRTHPTRNTFVGRGGVGVGFRRFSLLFRYLRTLSTSITDPFVYNDRSYSYINRRDGLQAILSYDIPLR